jgi:hypothetical protein
MTSGTLFVGFGSIIPGREKMASQVLGEAMHYLEGLRAEGAIASFDVVLLEPHGGELDGFVLVKGDKATLAQLRVSEAFVNVIVGVQLVHTRVGVVGAYSGSDLPFILGLWGRQEEKLL